MMDSLSSDEMSIASTSSSLGSISGSQPGFYQKFRHVFANAMTFELSGVPRNGEMIVNEIHGRNDPAVNISVMSEDGLRTKPATQLSISHVDREMQMLNERKHLKEFSKPVKYHGAQNIIETWERLYNCEQKLTSRENELLAQKTDSHKKNNFKLANINSPRQVQRSLEGVFNPLPSSVSTKIQSDLEHEASKHISQSTEILATFRAKMRSNKRRLHSKSKRRSNIRASIKGYSPRMTTKLALPKQNENHDSAQQIQSTKDTKQSQTSISAIPKTNKIKRHNLPVTKRKISTECHIEHGTPLRERPVQNDSNDLQSKLTSPLESEGTSDRDENRILDVVTTTKLSKPQNAVENVNVLRPNDVHHVSQNHDTTSLSLPSNDEDLHHIHQLQAAEHAVALWRQRFLHIQEIASDYAHKIQELEELNVENDLQYRDLNQKLRQSQDKESKLEAEIASLSDALTRSTAIVTQLRNAKEEQTVLLNKLQQDQNRNHEVELELSADRMRRMRCYFEEEIKTLQEKITLQSQKSQTSDRLPQRELDEIVQQQLQALHTSYTKETKALYEEIHQLQSECQSLRENLNLERNESDVSKTALHRLQQVTEQYDRNARKAEEELKANKEILEELRVQNQRYESEIAEMKNQILNEESLAAFNKLKLQNTEQANDLKKANSEVEDLKQLCEVTDREHKTYTEDLKSEISSLKLQVHRLKQDLQDLSKEYEDKTSETEKMFANSKTEFLSKSQKEIDDLHQELSLQSELRIQLESVCEREKKQNDAHWTEIQRLRAKNTSLHAENDELMKELTLTKEELQRNIGELQKAKLEKNVDVETLTLAQDQVAHLSGVVKQLHENLGDMQKQRAAESLEVTESRVEATNANNHANAYKIELASVLAQNQRLKDTLEYLKSAHQSEIDDLMKHIQTKDAQMKRLRERANVALESQTVEEKYLSRANNLSSKSYVSSHNSSAEGSADVSFHTDHVSTDIAYNSFKHSDSTQNNLESAVATAHLTRSNPDIVAQEHNTGSMIGAEDSHPSAVMKSDGSYPVKDQNTMAVARLARSLMKKTEAPKLSFSATSHVDSRKSWGTTHFDQPVPNQALQSTESSSLTVTGMAPTVPTRIISGSDASTNTEYKLGLPSHTTNSPQTSSFSDSRVTTTVNPSANISRVNSWDIKPQQHSSPTLPSTSLASSAVSSIDAESPLTQNMETTSLRPQTTHTRREPSSETVFFTSGVNSHAVFSSPSTKSSAERTSEPQVEVVLNSATASIVSVSESANPLTHSQNLQSIPSGAPISPSSWDDDESNVSEDQEESPERISQAQRSTSQTGLCIHSNDKHTDVQMQPDDQAEMVSGSPVVLTSDVSSRFGNASTRSISATAAMSTLSQVSVSSTVSKISNVLSGTCSTSTVKDNHFVGGLSPDAKQMDISSAEKLSDSAPDAESGNSASISSVNVQHTNQLVSTTPTASTDPSKILDESHSELTMTNSATLAVSSDILTLDNQHQTQEAHEKINRSIKVSETNQDRCAKSLEPQHDTTRTAILAALDDLSEDEDGDLDLSNSPEKMVTAVATETLSQTRSSVSVTEDASLKQRSIKLNTSTRPDSHTSSAPMESLNKTSDSSVVAEDASAKRSSSERIVRTRPATHTSSVLETSKKKSNEPHKSLFVRPPNVELSAQGRQELEEKSSRQKPVGVGYFTDDDDDALSVESIPTLEVTDVSFSSHHTNEKPVKQRKHESREKDLSASSNTQQKSPHSRRSSPRSIQRPEFTKNDQPALKSSTVAQVPHPVDSRPPAHPHNNVGTNDKGSGRLARYTTGIYASAVRNLSKLSHSNFVDLSKTSTVSDPIAVIAGATCIILGQRPSWKNAVVLFRKPDFLSSLLAADARTVAPRNVNVIKTLVQNKSLHSYASKKLDRQSSPAEAALIDWILALTDEVWEDEDQHTTPHASALTTTPVRQPKGTGKSTPEDRTEHPKSETNRTLFQTPTLSSRLAKASTAAKVTSPQEEAKPAQMSRNDQKQQKSVPDTGRHEPHEPETIAKNVRKFCSELRSGVNVYKFGKWWGNPQPRILFYENMAAGERLFWQKDNHGNSARRDTESSVRILEISQILRGNESALVKRKAKTDKYDCCATLSTLSRELALEFESKEKRDWFADGMELLLRKRRE